VTKFVKVRLVSTRPGNPVIEAYFDVEKIVGWSEASPEHALIGAATVVDNSIGSFYIKESVEEFYELVKEALKAV
jgi:hypothetical protein